ncbi:MAG: VanW family protein [Myxococcota bacterium]
MTRVAILLLGAGLVLGVGGPAAYWGVVQLGNETVPGLRIAGISLAPTAQPSEVVEPAAAEWLETRVTVESGSVRVEIPRHGLGVVADLPALDREALAVGRSGEPFTDLHAIAAARRGEIDLGYGYRWDDDKLDGFVRRLAGQVRQSSSPGRLDVSARVVEEPRSAVELPLNAAKAALRTAIAEGRTRIKLENQSTAPVGGDRFPKGVRFDAVLAEYETEFNRWGDYFGRAHNVRLAASRLHGAVILPDEVLSFNERVGPRRYGDGYRNAPVILKGELADGVGGGVCQVASTFHAAAFFGGLDPLQHVPHSRPSSYIPMGLDATVVWPFVDLRIRNPFDFPVLVASEIDENKHRVTLYGRSAPVDVMMQREYLDTRTFTNRTVVDPNLPSGTREVSQGGIRGYTVRRVRYLRTGTHESVEEAVLVYPPTDRIVRVGPS